MGPACWNIRLRIGSVDVKGQEKVKYLASMALGLAILGFEFVGDGVFGPAGSILWP